MVEALAFDSKEVVSLTPGCSTAGHGHRAASVTEHNNLVAVVEEQGRRSLWDRGDMSPNIYEGWRTSIVMSPPQYLGVYFSSNSNNCCLCILMQILCVVSQKNL